MKHHRHKVHQGAGLLIIAVLSLLVLLYFWFKSDVKVEPAVQQVPNDIKNLRAINEELREEGLTPVQF